MHYTSVAYGYLHVFLNNQKPTFYMWLIGDMHNACKYLKTEFREQNDWIDHSSFKHVAGFERFLSFHFIHGGKVGKENDDDGGRVDKYRSVRIWCMEWKGYQIKQT
jgi:hypothetical protein